MANPSLLSQVRRASWITSTVTGLAAEGAKVTRAIQLRPKLPTAQTRPGETGATMRYCAADRGTLFSACTGRPSASVIWRTRWFSGSITRSQGRSRRRLIVAQA